MNSDVLPRTSTAKCVFVASNRWCKYPTRLRRRQPDLPDRGLWTAKVWVRLTCPICGADGEKMILTTEHGVGVAECNGCRGFAWVTEDDLERLGWNRQACEN